MLSSMNLQFVISEFRFCIFRRCIYHLVTAFSIDLYDVVFLLSVFSDISVFAGLTSFCRAMHVVLARYCYRKSSVCPFVCPSVCTVDVPWAYRLPASLYYVFMKRHAVGVFSCKCLFMTVSYQYGCRRF